MSSSQDKRKLAAIMFADVVGYSRMMASNEKRTLELLKDFENICSPIISDNEGQIIKKVGDELFCEFSSAKQAVDSALAIQDAIQPYNDSRPKDFKLQVRIGIHIGDIVLRDGDVFGDGVNVASRIQPFASPGGICVSNAVRDALSSHPNYDIESEGKQELKNIIEKHTLYSIKTGFEDKTTIRKYRKSKKSIPIIIGILAACIIGMLFFSDSLNIWKMDTDDIVTPTQKVLFHLTSMSNYTSGFEKPIYYEITKGRELIALSDDELSSIRINFESMMLGEFFDIDKYEIIIPQSSEGIEFLNSYHLLDFSEESFLNVKENYKRFNKPNHIYYINIYKYYKDNEHEITTYFYNIIYWGEFTKYLNTKINDGGMNWGTNGSYFSQVDITEIEKELYNKFRSRLNSRGDIGNVSRIKDNLFYIKLNNLKIKKNMLLQGITEYDFKNKGREHRIYDLTQAIKFLKNKNDSIGQSLIKSYNNEIISLEQRTGFNRNNSRVFSTNFNYDLKVVDILDDTTAFAKLVQLNYPYVKPRVGNPVIIKSKD